MRSDALAGLPTLVRLVLRRDRIRIVLWSVAIVGLVAVSTASITSLYGTAAQLESYARLVRDNAALIVQSGPGHGLDDPTTGAVTMNEVGIWAIIAVALMSIFMTVRHTRAEEDTERAEIVRASPVGRHSPLAAALIGVALANVVIATGLAVTLIVYDLPAAGAVAFGLTLFATGMVFAGVAAVAAQVASGARTALALAGTVVGVSFVLRAIGDVGDGRLSWASPIGWGQAIRAFADERWWVLVIPLAATVVLVVLAVGLQAHRDLGAGLMGQRPGRASAGRFLAGPLGLSIRLQRASVVGWTVGVGLIGFFYGIVADQAESILEENPEAADFFAQFGEGSLTDAFLSTAMLVLALMASGFTVSSVLRLRSEEMAVRADPILATPTSRARWASSHLAVAIGGTAAIMAVAGLVTGAGFAIVSGDPGQIPRMLGAAFVMVPAMLVLAGVTALFHGLDSRLAMFGWAGLAWVIVAGMFGTILDLPQWALDVSPFVHVPALPAAPMSWWPMVLLVGIAVALMGLGLAALNRRDIG
jgi:ABC-2 type transport system permease protein